MVTKSEKPVILITGLQLMKIPKLRSKGNGILTDLLQFEPLNIPTLETALAFFGKTYLLVGSILNFTQVYDRIPKLPFRRFPCVGTHRLAQNLTCVPCLSPQGDWPY